MCSQSVWLSIFEMMTDCLLKTRPRLQYWLCFFQRDSCSIPSALESIFLPIIALIFHCFFCPLKLSKCYMPFVLNEARIDSLFVLPCLSSRLMPRSAKVLELLLTLQWCMYTPVHHMQWEWGLGFSFWLEAAPCSPWCSPLSTDSARAWLTLGT